MSSRSRLASVILAGLLVFTTPGISSAFDSYGWYWVHSWITEAAAKALGWSEMMTKILSEAVRQVDWDETSWCPTWTDWARTCANGKYDRRHHFDRAIGVSSATAFVQSAAYMVSQRDSAIRAVRAGHYASAIDALGRALHDLQDFKSHSNYIDLSPTLQKQCRDALFDSTKPLPDSLKLCGYDPTAPDPESPPGDPYPHGGKSKDNPHKNGEAETPVGGGKTKFDLAKDSAIQESIDLLKSVKDSLTAAQWDSLRNPNQGTDAFSYQYCWVCPTPCGPGGCIAVCQGHAVAQFLPGTFSGTDTVVVLCVDQSKFYSHDQTESRSGARTVAWQEYRDDALGDTAQFAIAGTGAIYFPDTVLAGLDRSSLNVYYASQDTLGWVAVAGGVVDPTGVATFPLARPGLYAVGGMPDRGAWWISDAFPANETPGLPGTPPFDTTSALVQIGLNTADLTATANRPDIPGDSLLISAALDNGRVDLVFRILPGVGNYVVVGNRASALRRVPTATTPAAAGDNSFWGQYLANDGAFGSPGGHSGGVWGPSVWNSARCDTAELNLFPVSARGGITSLHSTIWAATYHESDPKFTTLGIVKPMCFLVDTSGPVNSSNITCSSVPSWALASKTGYDGTSTTREHTKILPDGLFTPGTHVEYFLRASELATPAIAVLTPDTNYITPQGSDVDGHRWQEFSVLPDRWKSPSFGGDGMACMLFVDANDGKGSERVWVSAADTIGATVLSRRGAHNGWRARGDQPIDGVNVGGDPTIAVAAHGGQPGTIWDMFGIRGSQTVLVGQAGSLGSRLSTPPGGAASGKRSRLGPTPEMLRAYYRSVVLLSGDREDGVLGPTPNRSQNDVAVLEDYLANPSGTGQPRTLMVEGSGFVAGEWASGGLPGQIEHRNFLTSYLGVSFRDGDYGILSGNPGGCVLLKLSLPFGSNQFGLARHTGSTPDVLSPYAPGGGVASAFYPDYGPNGPYVAGVYAGNTVGRPWVSLVDGWNTMDLFSPYCESTAGRRAYLYESMTGPVSFACVPVGLPLVDVPAAVTWSDGIRIVSENPGRSGLVRIDFEVSRRQPVQITVHDLAGRAVRTLIRGELGSGPYHATWDGADDRGNHVNPGIYFVRMQTPEFRSARKVVWLR